MSTSTARRACAAALTVTAVALAGCAGAPAESGARTENGVDVLTMWTHNGGNNEELAINERIVADFNASQPQYRVELQSFPQTSYNDAVTAAASADNLPCILDIDAPTVPNWAWAGYLAPLELPESLFAGQLPSTLGVVGDELYSFGHYDVALSMVARRSVLEANGIRIPTVAEPWSGAEFDAALATLKATGAYPYPLDLGTSGAGEWLPYAYSPMLQSFGGDLIDRDGHQSAEGVLNGPAGLAWAQWMRGAIDKGWAAQQSGEDAVVDFVNGATAIAYTGSWAGPDVVEAFSDDAVFLPVPDFGAGPTIGGGSWQWGMSASCSAPEGARAYLEFSAQPTYYAEFSNTLGLIPASAAAVEEVPDFAEGGRYAQFLQYAQDYAQVRPVTPAYPFISSVFQKATQDILAGGDPQTILDKAAADIDANIATNGGYEF